MRLKFTACAKGTTHLLVLTNKGDVLSIGTITHGQLGDKTFDDRRCLKPIIGLDEEVSSIAAGYDLSLALTTAGRIYYWGRNTYFPFDLDRNKTIPFPLDNLPKNIVAVTSGKSHFLFLAKEGQVYGWGSNSYGQLGTLNKIKGANPVRVNIPVKIKNIAAGSEFSLALDESGQVWAWGQNHSLQLGNPHLGNLYETTGIAEITDSILQIKAGNEHAIALAINGRIWTWGNNRVGHLGIKEEDTEALPSCLTKIKASIQNIAAGANSTLVLTKSGSIWGWGDLSYYPKRPQFSPLLLPKIEPEIFGALFGVSGKIEYINDLEELFRSYSTAQFSYESSLSFNFPFLPCQESSHYVIYSPNGKKDRQS